MYIAILTVIVLLLFSIWLVSSFFVNILELIINLVILWAVCVRGHVELEKEKKHYYYLIGLLITIILFLVTRLLYTTADILHLWWPVLFLVIVFLFAQLSILFYKSYIKYIKR